MSDIEAGHNQIVTICSLPLNNTEENYYRKNGNCTNCFFYQGTTKICKTGEENDAVIKNYKSQWHVTYEYLRDIQMRNKLYNPDKSI